MLPGFFGPGFGTMEYVDGKHSGNPAAVMYEATQTALETGYRIFDCAEMYDSTDYVGKAFGESMKSGQVKREELFIITKLKGLPSGEDYQMLKIRLQEHLAKLQIEHADLILIHWPGPSATDLSQPRDTLTTECSWDYFDANIDKAWKNMQQLKQDGLASEIGVANFYPQHLDRLCEGTQVRPFANQIFMDMTHQETEFAKKMLEDGIRPIAYRPTAYLPVAQMANAMGDTTWAVLEAAQCELDHIQSVHGFVLRWFLSQGILPLVKSSNEDHCMANFTCCCDAGKRELSEAVMADLRKVDGSELVTMCGGTDEVAMVFKGMTCSSRA